MTEAAADDPDADETDMLGGSDGLWKGKRTEACLNGGTFSPYIQGSG